MPQRGLHQVNRCTVIERMANSQIVAARVAKVFARLDDLDSKTRACASKGTDRSVGRTVVDNDDSSLCVMQLAQRFDAGERVGETIPVQDNDPY